MPDILSGLIWVKTVSKSYQQITLGDNELKNQNASKQTVPPTNYRKNGDLTFGFWIKAHKNIKFIMNVLQRYKDNCKKTYMWKKQILAFVMFRPFG